MKQAEAIRSSEEPKTPPVGRPIDVQEPALKKPVGPMTYSVSKGSDVFWSGKLLKA